MEAMKKALEKKMAEHKMKQNAHEDMGHRDEDLLADESAADEQAEDGKDMDDMAPSLHDMKGDMDEERAEHAMPQMNGDASHMEILKALADKSSTHHSGLGARAAMGAKEKLEAMKKMKK